MAKKTKKSAKKTARKASPKKKRAGNMNSTWYTVAILAGVFMVLGYGLSTRKIKFFEGFRGVASTTEPAAVK